MSSSRPAGPRQVPPPPGSKAGTPYTRFIPREELQGFANWNLGTFGPEDGVASGGFAPGSAAAQAQPPEPVDVDAALRAARQAGYQDGYRDGLAALESFKLSFAQQMSGQFVPLLNAFGAQLDAHEQQIAATVAQVATQLARQVVRSELAVRPELVTEVAREAVNAVLLSARDIVVHVHPDDHELISAEAGEALASRGARLVPQPGVERGGCLVETDAGVVDARIEARWNDAVQALGTGVTWAGGEPKGPPAPAVEPEDR